VFYGRTQEDAAVGGFENTEVDAKDVIRLFDLQMDFADQTAGLGCVGGVLDDDF
jgi:hypothetical protein